MQINIDQGEEVQQSFFFEPIPNKFLQEKQFKQVLTKWGLLNTLKIGSFRFNQHFQQYDLQRFLKDLFNNPNIRYVLSNIKYPMGSFSSVEFTKLKCDELSMQMFQELEKEGVVKSDFIQKTFSQYFQQIEICDKIRECLLLQQSESYCIYNQNQRKQFLLKLFQALVIGGSLNQYEDKLTPYLQWTKKLYKNLVSVRKRPETSQIFIQSIVVKIKSMDQGKLNKQSFNPQTFIYVVINPSLRVTHILTNQWIKFW